MPVTTWTPKLIMGNTLDALEANGEIAGKFVETEARKRLLAITDPEWGKGYREKVVARLLTHRVTRHSDRVVIAIGVRQSQSRRGVARKKHGLYIELGSKTAPAHPFLRPAVHENKDKIVALLNGE